MPEHQQIQQSKNLKPSSQRRTIPASQNHVSNPAAIIQRAKIDPKSLTPVDVLQLQSTIGNRAVGKLLLEITRPSSTVQQVQIQQQKQEEKEVCPSCVQRQEIPEEEEPLQGKMIGPIQWQETPEEEEPLQTKRENNTGMPDNLKAGVESLSGIDMSNVKVHYNSSKPAEIGALAYTQGTDIHIAPGQEKHLPHEAWHVVQQAQGRVRPTFQMKGVAVNDEKRLEQEADELSKAIVSGDSIQLKKSSHEVVQMWQSDFYNPPPPHSRELNDDQFLVILSNENEKWHGHTVLTIQGNSNGIWYQTVNFFPDKPDNTWINNTFGPVDGRVEQRTSYGSNTPEIRGPVASHRTVILINKEQLERLQTEINNDKEKPPKYAVVGNPLSFIKGERVENCHTWAISVLTNAGIDVPLIPWLLPMPKAVEYGSH